MGYVLLGIMVRNESLRWQNIQICDTVFTCFFSFVNPDVETFFLSSLKLSSLPVGSALTAGLNCEVRPVMPEATERGCN